MTASLQLPLLRSQSSNNFLLESGGKEAAVLLAAAFAIAIVIGAITPLAREILRLVHDKGKN